MYEEEEQDNMGRRILASLNRKISNIKCAFGLDTSNAEKEEKAVLSVKKEPIPVEQFHTRLKQKKTDKHLNIEVRVSSTLKLF